MGIDGKIPMNHRRKMGIWWEFMEWIRRTKLKDLKGYEKLPARLINILNSGAIESIEDLTNISRSEILDLRNMGQKTLMPLEVFMKYHKIKFKPHTDYFCPHRLRRIRYH